MGESTAWSDVLIDFGIGAFGFGLLDNLNRKFNLTDKLGDWIKRSLGKTAKETAEEAADLRREDFFYYDVESPENCDIGWYTYFKGDMFLISEKRAILKKGEFLFTYRLGRGGLGCCAPQFNDKISGMSLLEKAAKEAAEKATKEVVEETAEEAANRAAKEAQQNAIQSVENGKTSLTNNMQKGNYGEMKMDQFFESQGYSRVSLDRVTGLDDVTHHGIDGIYYNPNGKPPYIIGEAKFGSSRLSQTPVDGPQMSDQWILGSDRLENAVGKDLVGGNSWICCTLNSDV